MYLQTKEGQFLFYFLVCSIQGHLNKQKSQNIKFWLSLHEKTWITTDYK